MKTSQSDKRFIKKTSGKRNLLVFVFLLISIFISLEACNHAPDKENMGQMAGTNSEKNVEELDSFTSEQLAKMTPEEVAKLDESQYDYFDLSIEQRRAVMGIDDTSELNQWLKLDYAHACQIPILAKHFKTIKITNEIKSRKCFFLRNDDFGYPAIDFDMLPSGVICDYAGHCGYYLYREEDVMDPNYMVEIGEQYEKGQGREKDPQKAFYYYEKAAKAGDPTGLNKMGNMYSLGLGCTRNPATAVYYYKQAAEKGNMYAQYNLANFYWVGSGVEENKDIAITWFRRSAAQGYKPAVKFLQDIGAKY